MPVQLHEARNPITKAWNALSVILLDDGIHHLLGGNDPMALEQIKDARESLKPLFEVERKCIHCGHTDIVKCVDDNPGMYGSAFSFCTQCDRPWNSESVDCDCHHCDRHGNYGN